MKKDLKMNEADKDLANKGYKIQSKFPSYSDDIILLHEVRNLHYKVTCSKALNAILFAQLSDYYGGILTDDKQGASAT